MQDTAFYKSTLITRHGVAGAVLLIPIWFIFFLLLFLNVWSKEAETDGILLLVQSKLEVILKVKMKAKYFLNTHWPKRFPLET